MAKPVVAIVGRPNVGKSQLFNRLAGKRLSIVEDTPGVTRDRLYADSDWRGRDFTVIDTGGIEPSNDNEILQFMRLQAETAISHADVIILITDLRTGVTAADQDVASMLLRSGKPIVLAVNKCDKPGDPPAEFYEFYNLGLGEPFGISALHGYGVGELLDAAYEHFPAADEEEEDDERIRVALIGKPNVGKSSLLNRVLGEERVIVSNVAGTTRDSVDIPFVSDGRACEFVDTAGVRRRTRITDTVERFSVNSSLKTTTKADVTLYVIDALEGVTAQDKRLIDLLDERKTPFMILVNKIDLVGRKEQAALEKSFKEVLQFCPHVPVLMVSAMKQVGLGRIVPLAAQIREECNTRIGTGALNRAMEEVLTKHQPPVVKRSRPKFFYLTQAEVAPPTFVFFVSDADRVSETYARYLDRSLRKIFRIEHAPIRVRLRSSHKKKSE
mgnify:CR=1 FL=1